MPSPTMSLEPIRRGKFTTVGGQVDEFDEERSSVVDEVCALISAVVGVDPEEVIRGLRADAAAFGLSVTEVAEDVLAAARSRSSAPLRTISELLATATPPRECSGSLGNDE